jgi:cyclo(L-tyrosyl-L-tyrosyl) synthase
MELVRGLSGYATKQGYKFYEKGDFALVPLCPGNGYFKPKVIEELLAFVSKKFLEVCIFMPDVPAIHTYKGLGYSEIKAEAKARRQGRRLTNYAKRAIEKIQLENTKVKFKVIDWNETINPDSGYRSALSEMNKLYTENLDFRKEIHEETTRVVKNHLKEGIKLEDAVEEGARYVLEEVAFLSASSKIFGKKQISYIYYMNWPLLENFIGGAYDGKKKDNFGFIMIH